MRTPKAMRKLTPLLKKPCFTSEEARGVGVHPSVLAHYVNSGRLRRIRRGVYQSIDYENPHSFQWEDLIEAVYSVKEGVVCLISALAIYELTDEIPRQHWIAIPHVKSFKTTKNLKIVRFRDMLLGRTELELEGRKIPIFDRERTIIDAFRLLSREISIKALKAAIMKSGGNKIDFIKIQEYAKELRFDITPYLMTITT